MNILNEIIGNSGYIVAGLASLEIIGTYFFPQAWILKIPKAVRLVKLTVDAIKIFRDTLQKWEETEGGYSNKKQN